MRADRSAGLSPVLSASLRERAESPLTCSAFGMQWVLRAAGLRELQNTRENKEWPCSGGAHHGEMLGAWNEEDSARAQPHEAPRLLASDVLLACICSPTACLLAAITAGLGLNSPSLCPSHPRWHLEGEPELVSSHTQQAGLSHPSPQLPPWLQLPMAKASALHTLPRGEG